MLVDAPDWATRHNYHHHSNPRSKDRAKTIYEKCHVRPQISAAWKVIKSKDATDHERITARDVITRLSDNRSNSAMEAGKAVQLATDLHLVPDQFDTTLSLQEATETAVRALRQYTPQDYNDTVRENDTARKDKYLDELPLVIENAVAGLTEAMRQENRILGEIDLIDCLPGNAVPHFTKPDYARAGDLKTKWSKISSRAKSGWQAGSLPRTLTGMFDMNNIYQVAGFWALNGQRPPWLLGLVSPDWRAIYWNEPPTYLAEAKKMWGVQ
mgnify:CR=1 FL=1